MKLDSMQKRAVESTARQTVVIAGPGCHRKGQEILMFDGSLKRVEDIIARDVLMGPDSKPRTVLELKRGAGEVVEVRPVKGDPFVVNLDHTLTVRLSGNRYSQWGLVDVSVRNWLLWSKRKQEKSKLERIAVEFDCDRTLSVDPYFLGALLGDGSIGPGVCLSKPGGFIRDLCEAEARRWRLHLRLRQRSEGTDNPTFEFSAGKHKGQPRTGKNPLLNALRKLGLFGKRAENKFVPHIYKVSASRDRSKLLAGLLDTDGYLANGTCDFVSKSKRLAFDVVFIARSLGLAAYVQPCKKGCQTGFVGDYWRVSISGEMTSLPLRRLKPKKRRQVKNVLRTGFTIRVLRSEESFFGFRLDGDGRYLLADFSITHNSGKTRVLVERVAHLLSEEDASPLPADICVVTFTNAAAAEVQRRLREHQTLSPDETNIGYVGTLHTLMFRLICARPELVEHVGRIIVIDEEQADEILKEVIESLRYRGTQRDVREAMKLGPGVLSQNRGHTPPTQPETVAMEYYRRMRSNGLMDFDSILWYGARLLERTKEAHDFSHLLVDEMQDSGDADVEIYRGMNCQTFCVGDPKQCQPAGTLISMSDGSLRPIERVRRGDHVLTYDRHSKSFLRRGRVSEVAERDFSGALYCVAAGGQETRTTGNHRWLIRWLSGEEREVLMFCTYLMRKGDMFRIGKSKLFGGKKGERVLGCVTRLRQENADAVWMLKLHATSEDALAHEAILVATYGLSDVCFISGSQSHISQSTIDRIFASVPSQLSKAVRCLTDHGRDLNFPIVKANERQSRRTLQEVEACNLIEDIMFVPVLPDGRYSYRKRGCQWSPLKIRTQEFRGKVFSLEVEKHHKYVADGLATCNSIYSFRGGNPRHLTRMAMDEENKVLSLPNNYRCDAAICRVANALMRGKGHDETVSMTERDGVVTFHGYQTELSETGALTDALTKLDRPKDCAVLVRTNWLAERYAEALTNAGIPVAKKAQLTRPKDWRAARDIVMMLADPSNDHLTYRVLTRSRGREDADKMKLAAMQAFKSINSLWLNLPETMDVGLVGPALARAKIGPESIALIEQLIRDNTSLKTVAELTVALAQEDLTRQEEGEGVTVTTMHSAKGREWDHVFLPAFNEGVVPNARRDSDEEEERRLVFVAVTRSRHTLSVTWAALRTERWKREPVGVEPSRFLEQMRG